MASPITLLWYTAIVKVSININNNNGDKQLPLYNAINNTCSSSLRNTDLSFINSDWKYDRKSQSDRILIAVTVLAGNHFEWTHPLKTPVLCCLDRYDATEWGGGGGWRKPQTTAADGLTDGRVVSKWMDARQVTDWLRLTGANWLLQSYYLAGRASETCSHRIHAHRHWRRAPRYDYNHISRRGKRVLKDGRLMELLYVYVLINRRGSNTKARHDCGLRNAATTRMFNVGILIEFDM